MSGKAVAFGNNHISGTESESVFGNAIAQSGDRPLAHKASDPVENVAPTVRSAAPPSTGLAESLAAYVRDDEAMQHTYRLAERHGRLPRESFIAREVVADVIADMLMGDARCDPESTVSSQIEREVLRRAKRLRKANQPRGGQRHAPRLEFVPLEMAPIGALVIDAAEEEFGGGSAPDAAELVFRIRELAREDDAVQQLVTLAERGIVLRRDVLGAGMTEWVYRAARERLARYAEMALSAARPPRRTRPPSKPPSSPGAVTPQDPATSG